MSEETPEVGPDEAPPATEPPKKTRKRTSKASAPSVAGVDDYPERPYLEAITDEHKAALEKWGQLPKAS